MSIFFPPILGQDTENAAPDDELSPGTTPVEVIRRLRRRRYSEVSSDITPPSPLSGLSSFDGTPRSLSPVILPRPESAFDVSCVGLWGATDWDTDDVVIDGGHEEQQEKNCQGKSAIGDSISAKRQLEQTRLLESVAKKLKPSSPSTQSIHLHQLVLRILCKSKHSVLTVAKEQRISNLMPNAQEVEPNGE
ncbi:hypothetical protein L5515_017427 [Caenorhabditis briggsae]|uniref:Uncharacterized protein n=1 Tax=Caenorhabditis briggsae TaxID=6238 RepID=A0AAE9JQ31_CAEBR|nr:hypothetical protein L5515_017427 [Caenorhabditis briggsae]